MTSDEYTRPRGPVLAFDRNGSCEAFVNAESIAGEVEAVDVVDGEYEFYMTDGTILAAEVEGFERVGRFVSGGIVTLKRTALVDKQVLAQKLEASLRAQGRTDLVGEPAERVVAALLSARDEN